MPTMYNYHFLARKFGLPDLFPTSWINQKLNKNSESGQPDNPNFHKLVDRNQKPSRNELEIASKYDVRTKCMLNVLYCDIYPIDETEILDDLSEEATKGGYYLTHALLTLQWIKENKCMDIEKMKDLERNIMIKHAELLNSVWEENDIPMEAVSYLLYANRKDMVDPMWIKIILSKQVVDGGWKQVENHLQTSPHTTISALWAILEWNTPKRLGRLPEK